GRSKSNDVKPTCWQALRLLRTYTADAGSAPTSTTARPGAARPASILDLTPVATRSSTSPAILRPSRMRAVMCRRTPKRALSWRGAEHTMAYRARHLSAFVTQITARARRVRLACRVRNRTEYLLP